MPHSRFPRNAPGDFYTTGECLACGFPEHEAPECLASLDADDNRVGDTYFLRQPMTTAEIRNACAAAKVCCVDAIRYAGTDPAVLVELGNTSRYCDFPRR